MTQVARYDSRLMSLSPTRTISRGYVFLCSKQGPLIGPELLETSGMVFTDSLVRNICFLNSSFEKEDVLVDGVLIKLVSR
jgi:hypothetical protein